MHSQRGVIGLFHSDAQRDAFVRRGNAMAAQGDDAILLDREGLRELAPYLDFDDARLTRLRWPVAPAAAPPGTTRWPAAMPAPPTPAAST